MQKFPSARDRRKQEELKGVITFLPTNTLTIYLNMEEFLNNNFSVTEDKFPKRQVSLLRMR